MNTSIKKYGRWALITGGSAGIGYAFAKQLAEKGHNLILAARNQERLDDSASKLIAAHGIKVKTIAIDLAKTDAPAELHRQTRKEAPGLVILNAGIETTGHFTRVESSAHRKLIDLNIQAPAEMARLYGADMVAKGRGGLVFLSSLFGYQGVPLVANYAASKAYILSLGEALHVEMKPYGVDVLVLSPGLTNTDMPANMPVDFNKMPITQHTPAKVARVGLNALGKTASVVPGLINTIFAFENRFIPRNWPVNLFGFLLENAIPKDKRTDLLNHKTSGATS